MRIGIEFKSVAGWSIVLYMKIHTYLLIVKSEHWTIKESAVYSSVNKKNIHVFIDI